MLTHSEGLMRKKLTKKTMGKIVEELEREDNY